MIYVYIYLACDIPTGAFHRPGALLRDRGRCTGPQDATQDATQDAGRWTSQADAIGLMPMINWMWVKMEDHSWDHRCECLV